MLHLNLIYGLYLYLICMCVFSRWFFDSDTQFSREKQHCPLQVQNLKKYGFGHQLALPMESLIGNYRNMPRSAKISLLEKICLLIDARLDYF